MTTLPAADGVRLDARDHRLADAMAAAERKRFASAPTQVEFNPDTYDWKVGPLGDIAFAKLFGFPLGAPGRDDGYDFLLPDGRKVDVKATAAKGASYLQRPEYMPCKADLYVMFFIVGDDYARLGGWCGRGDLLAAPIRKKGDGEHPAVYCDTRMIHERDLRAVPPGA